MKTGRANLLNHPNGHFVIGEYPIPEPAPDAMLIKIELCGVCGTDVHSWHAPAEAVFGLEYPISLGHEISGTSTHKWKPLYHKDTEPFISCFHAETMETTLSFPFRSRFHKRHEK